MLTPLRILVAATPATEHFPRLKDAFETVSTAADARRSVERLARGRGRFVAFHDISCCRRTEIELEVPSAIIRYARRLGLAVAIQTSSVSSAKALVRAGAGIVASSVCDREVDDALVSEMLTANAVYAPGLVSESVGFDYGTGRSGLTTGTCAGR